MRKTGLIKLFSLFFLALTATGLVLGVASATVTISATKIDTLIVDNDGDGEADPGDVISYTVTITNSGDMDATTVVFNDTIDSNTTLVGGSL